MDEQTLTPEQIQNWRQIIFMQLEQMAPGSGAYAIIMPESEVIQYWKKMKTLVEKLEPEPKPQKPEYIKPKCNHTNSITGQLGKYCLDCEKYV